MTHPETLLTAAQQQRYQRMIQQRCQHIPLPYLTGTSDFFGQTFRVTPAVLVPRPFTELLVETVLKRVPPDTTLTIADVGTGSGAIALALASQLSKAKILATDISQSALTVARKNTRRLGLSNRLTFQKTSLLTSLKVQPDVVVANLPYLTRIQLRAPSIRHEPKIALDGGRQGLQLIDKLIRQATHIPSITTIVLEFDPPQARQIRIYLKKWSSKVTILAISDGRRIRGFIADK